MESLIEVFHLDIKLLIAQIVNFAIVFGILYFFILKPILGVMRERTKTIEKSLADATEIENRLGKTKEECNKIIRDAKKEAAEIIVAAQALAEEKKKEKIAKTKDEIGALIDQEKIKMQQAKNQVLKEIRAEVAGLVEVSLEKILDKKIDEKSDSKIIKKTLKN